MLFRSSAIATDDLFGHGQLGLLLVGDGALLGITGREIDHAGAAVAITADGHSPVAVDSSGAVAKSLRHRVTTHRRGEWTGTGAGSGSGNCIIDLRNAIHLHVERISGAVATDDLLGNSQLWLLLVGDGALLRI